MLDMLRSLVAHKGHADAALLNAVRHHPGAASDPEILELFHHVLIANRFWLLTVVGAPFEHEAEAGPSTPFEALVGRFAATHAREMEWLDAATEEDLARQLRDPRIPGGQCSIDQALTQVCLRSHGHRAQCAKLLRRHGVVPPAGDFILWLPTRTVAAWQG